MPDVSSRPYSLLGGALLGGLINAVINAAIGFVIVPPGERLPLWGIPSVALDTVAMAFCIAFGTGFGLTRQLRAQRRAGKLHPPSAPRDGSVWTRGFERWPASLLHRSVNLGVLATLVFVPPALLALWWLVPGGFERSGLTLYKGAFGALAGATLTPFIGLGAFWGPEAPRAS